MGKTTLPDTNVQNQVRIVLFALDREVRTRVTENDLAGLVMQANRLLTNQETFEAACNGLIACYDVLGLDLSYEVIQNGEPDNLTRLIRSVLEAFRNERQTSLAGSDTQT